MPAAYDLIILGNTPTAYRIAKIARQHHARTALIVLPHLSPPLTELLTTLHHWPELRQSLTLTAQDLKTYVDRLTTHHSELTELINLGVDVIQTTATFRRYPNLHLHIPGNDQTRNGLGSVSGHRQLTARTYMLALAPQTIDLTPEKLTPQQLEGINHWTIANLPTQLDQLLQISSLTILGTSPTAIALAQTLQTLGKRITIVTSQPSLLPHLQPKIQTALQSQLQAQGITLYLNTTIQTIIQTTANQPPITLKTNQGEITNDGLMLGNHATILNDDQLNSLNLAAARVRRQGQTICVDRYGRASRKIYVCDANPAQIGCDQTIIVERVLHALKLPALSPATPPAITVALTNPTLVTIGLSAIQAQKRYGRQIFIFSRSLNTQLKAQVLDQTNGICELIVRANGTIVGTQIFAAQAEEWTGILALAIQQKIPLQSLAACPLPTGSFAELINDLAREYRYRKANQKWPSKFIESWFAWLREISN